MFFLVFRMVHIKSCAEFFALSDENIYSYMTLYCVFLLKIESFCRIKAKENNDVESAI